MPQAAVAAPVTTGLLYTVLRSHRFYLLSIVCLKIIIKCYIFLTVCMIQRQNAMLISSGRRCDINKSIGRFYVLVSDTAYTKKFEKTGKLISPNVAYRGVTIKNDRLAFLFSRKGQLCVVHTNLRSSCSFHSNQAEFGCFLGYNLSKKKIVEFVMITMSHDGSETTSQLRTQL